MNTTQSQTTLGIRAIDGAQLSKNGDQSIHVDGPSGAGKSTGGRREGSGVASFHGSTERISAARDASPYMAPRELAVRWQCSRSSVDRIALRAGLTRVCLGDGPNGMVRYIRREVEEYEARRRTRPTR